MAGYIGTKAVNLSTTGADIAGDADVSGALDVGGGLTVDNDGSTVLTVDRATSDGTIIDLKKSGSSVGVVGVHTSNEIYISNSSNIGLRTEQTGLDRIEPCFSTGAGRDNGIDLGSTDYRFNDLYLSGGVFLGGTGSANKLDDYEEGTWTPQYNDGQNFNIGAVAVYRKVGNLVWVNFDVTGASGRSSSTINNLPFTSSSTGGNFSGYTGYETLSTSSPIYSHMNANGTYVQLFVGSTSVSINAGERYIGAVVYSTD
jgi:hypothetical protein